MQVSKQNLLRTLLPVLVVLDAMLLVILFTSSPWIKSLPVLVLSGFGLSAGLLYWVAECTKDSAFNSSDTWQHLLMAALSGPAAIALGFFSRRLRGIFVPSVGCVLVVTLAYVAGKILGRKLLAPSRKLRVMTFVLVFAVGAGWGVSKSFHDENGQTWMHLLLAIVDYIWLGLILGCGAVMRPENREISQD